MSFLGKYLYKQVDSLSLSISAKPHGDWIVLDFEGLWIANYMEDNKRNN